MRWGLGAEDVSNPSDSGLIFFFFPHPNGCQTSLQQGMKWY